MSEARCPLVREIEEAANEYADTSGKTRDRYSYDEQMHADRIVYSQWYDRLRAALEAAEEMAEWMSDPSCEHSNLGECRPCAILARYRAATRDK